MSMSVAVEVAVDSCSSGPKRLLPLPKRVGADVGFLLLDSCLSPISFNTEAVQILGYPQNAGELGSLSLTETSSLLATKVRSVLIGERSLVTEFDSGGRRYFCRAFYVTSN